MRSIILLSVLLPFACAGQGLQDNATSLSLSGSIEMPALMSINVSQGIQHNMEINDFNEVLFGKVYPAYLHLNIKSNVPWNISVMTDTKYFSSSSAIGSKNMPVSLVGLKPTTQSVYTHLSNTPQTLFCNKNNRIENTYAVDLKIDSPVNYYGGAYTFNIVFTLSPQ